MRVLHVCLAAFYIDGYGYQENILPKMHKYAGHEVEILASTENYLENKQLGYVKPSIYLNEDQIRVTRIPYVKWLPHKIAKKLRIYTGIINKLEQFNPDIIFLHNTQFLGAREIIKFIRNHNNVKLYADGHTDYVNSARNWVSKNILHRIIYRYSTKLLEPYTEVFYGTLPAREVFIEEMYGINPDKIKLLEIGADDSLFDLAKYNEIRKATRSKIGLNDDDFVLITGGKIDKRKNIHSLMKAMKVVRNIKVKLIIFGEPNNEMKQEFLDLMNDNIISVGWLSPSEIYNFLFAADLGVFPGTHSVVWEQSVGVGLPCIFKRWDNVEHIDIGGNCEFIEEVNVLNIAALIEKISKDELLFNKMKAAALGKESERFLYSKIAERAIS